MVIQNDKSISDNYTALLVRLREIDNEEQSGASICAWCGHPKSKHLPDKRCSTWATAQYFTAKRHKEREAVTSGLRLIEELRGLTVP